jgi:hypothetical protein
MMLSRWYYSHRNSPNKRIKVANVDAHAAGHDEGLNESYPYLGIEQIQPSIIAASYPATYIHMICSA